MIRFSFLTFLVVFQFSRSYSQTDTLNQIDSSGKKNGWCVAYMDENLKILKDSTGAKYCMYNYYRSDVWLYRFGEGYGTKKSPIIPPKSNTLTLGNYSLLHGKYITKYENGNLRSELTTNNGYMTHFKRFYSTGELKFEVIVSEDCGAPIQHCLKEYNKNGSLKYEGHTWLPKEK